MPYDTLLGLAAEAFGITDAHEEDAKDDQARLQRATAYMERDIAKPISVTDLAREVGTSIRSLQLVFQRTGHGTPQAHLRALRMAAARHALTTASEPLLISDVAHRFGYVNIGRFDAHYLDAYDRLPRTISTRQRANRRLSISSHPEKHIRCQPFVQSDFAVLGERRPGTRRPDSSCQTAVASPARRVMSQAASEPPQKPHKRVGASVIL